MQLKMFAEAAEKTRKGTDGRSGGGVPPTGMRAGAKAAGRKRGAKPALVMEEIANVVNQRRLRKLQQIEVLDRIRKRRGWRATLAAAIPSLWKGIGLENVWIPVGGEKRIELQCSGTGAVLPIMQPHFDLLWCQTHGFRLARATRRSRKPKVRRRSTGGWWTWTEKYFDTVSHKATGGSGTENRRPAHIELIKRMRLHVQ